MDIGKTELRQLLPHKVEKKCKNVVDTTLLVLRASRQHDLTMNIDGGVPKKCYRQLKAFEVAIILSKINLGVFQLSVSKQNDKGGGCVAREDLLSVLWQVFVRTNIEMGYRDLIKFQAIIRKLLAERTAGSAFFKLHSQNW